MTKNKRCGGRPRKEECDKKFVTSFRTDSITRRRLERLTKQANRTISEVLREAVRNAAIEKSTYHEYLRSRKVLTDGDVLGLLVVNTHVVEAMPKEIMKIIRDFYKASVNINGIVKFLKTTDYNQLVWDYVNLKDEVDVILKELMGFIYEYRQGKEVKS